MSLWYRTGGTRNWKWHVVSADDKAKAAVGLHRAGYATVEADRQPTEWLPEGAIPGAHSADRIAAAKPALEAAVARAILSPEALVDIAGSSK